VFLIYIDEFGNTGEKLDTPKQPLYQLQAALVPADNRWVWLENGLFTLSRGLQERLQLREAPHLHAVEIYQRSGYYRKPPNGLELEPEEAFEVFNEVFSLSDRAGILYTSILIDKIWLLDLVRDELKKKGAHPELIRRTKSMPGFRQMAFILLLEWLDLHLRNLGAYGVVFFEQEKPQVDRDLALSTVYAALRQVGHFQRILDAPSPKAKRTSLLLALADFAGYVSGNVYLSNFFGRPERPHLDEWYTTHIYPRVLGDLKVGERIHAIPPGSSTVMPNNPYSIHARLTSIRFLAKDPTASLSAVVSELEKAFDKKEGE